MGELTTMSIAELQSELERKQQRLETLKFKRDELQTELAEVDREIELLLGEGVASPAPKAAPPAKAKAKQAKKGAAKTGSRKRGRRPTLAAAIKEVMAESGQPMRAGEIANALKERRFKTKSKDLENLVREGLNRTPDVKRVGHGLYQVEK